METFSYVALFLLLQERIEHILNWLAEYEYCTITRVSAKNSYCRYFNGQLDLLDSF